MRVFHAGRSLPSLILWGFLAIGGIVLLWEPAFSAATTSGRLLSGALILLLALLGPAAALLHAVRCAQQRTIVDPDRGLVLQGGGVLPWESIRAVEVQPVPFQALTLFREDEDLDGLPGDGYFLLLLARSLWAVVYCLLLPGFAILSPWNGCVTLRMRDGPPLVRRDLQDQDLFVRLVKIGMAGRRHRAERLARA